MRSKIAYIALSIFIACLPLLIVSSLLALRFNKTLLDHAPFYSDELYDWHQSRSFAAVGFQNGYYSLDENVPLLGFSHYYAWGAWPFVYYGLVGQLFGFGLNALALVNALTFTATAAFFIWLVRPSWERLLWLGAAWGTFIPLLLYLPSSLLEAFNMALGLILAAGFYHLLQRPLGKKAFWGLLLFTFLAGCIRPTFALYLFPLFVLSETERNFKTIIFAGLKAAPLILLAALAFYLTAAPFPHFRSLLFLGDEPLGVKLANFAAYVQQSLIWLLSGEAVVLLQRAQIGVLLLLFLAWGIWQWRKQPNERAWRWELALHLYNLLGFYLATLLFHETFGGHDYRVMAVHLLFSLVLLAVQGRRFLLGVMLALALWGMPVMWEQYNWKDANFGGYVQQQYSDWASRIQDVLVYEPDAASAWCNTLTTSAFYLLDPAGQPGMLLTVPAGFGLSWATDWSFPDFPITIPPRYQIPSQFQSRYLLLTTGDYAAWGKDLNLEPLLDAPNGALYLNLDADC